MNYFRTAQVVPILFAIFAIASGAMGCAAESKTAPIALTATNMQAWKRHILPTEEELAWMKIPWLPDLQSGIDAAAKAGKPVLLWTMNGHPLGCT